MADDQRAAESLPEAMRVLVTGTLAAPVPLGSYDVVGLLGYGGMGNVYRAIDRERGTPVALKTLHVSDAGSVARLKREFRAVADMSHPGLVPVYELATDQGIWFFTMELVDGVDFVTWARGERRRERQRPLTLLTTLDSEPGTTRISDTVADVASGVVEKAAAAVAEVEPTQSSAPLRSYDELRGALLQLVEALNALHAADLRHGDVKPSNVLVRPDGRVVLVDFGLTQSTAQQSEVMAGTPLYMAPELYCHDRPRTSRADEGEPGPGPWSDFYALGTMLYEVLTGHAPYRRSASLCELLCAKLHAQPLAPEALVADTPRDLSDLCSALMRPEVSERLGGEALQRQLAGEEMPRSHARPRSRGRFVGRRGELHRLEHAYGRARAGSVTLARVEGSSGIGKSTLVQQFLRSVAQLDGALVLRGRCYERETVPYKAFDDVAETLAEWLQHAAPVTMPSWAGELALVFPAFGTLEACASAVAALSPAPEAAELRRRSWRALAELLATLGHERPVVVYIDDLQWTDDDSARLLVELLNEVRDAPLLFIVSHRPEAASEAALGPLWVLAEELAVDGACVDIHMDALARTDAETLAQDVLRTHGATAEHAAEIAREAGGVPLFVEELARYAAARQEAVVGRAVTLDEALSARVGALPDTQRALVEVAALAARPVPQSVVFEAAGLDAAAIPDLLALRSASLLSWSGAAADDLVSIYHDRIRESVVSAQSDDAKQLGHLALGRALAARSSQLDLQDGSVEGRWLFDAVRHLEAAESLLLDAEERRLAARLNLHAGSRARQATSFSLALHHYLVGLRLLSDSRWSSDYELTLSLALGAAEAAWLTGDFSLAEQRLDDVYQHARSPLDRVPAWRVDISSRVARRALLDALKVVREALSELGVTLPEAPGDAEVGAAVGRAMEALGSDGVGRLETLAEVRDPIVVARMQLLTDASSSAYYAMPALLPVIACELVVSSVERGPSAATPFGLAIYGIVLNALGQLKESHQVGRVAFRMLDRWTDRSLVVRTRLVVHNNVCSWVVPLQLVLPDLLATYQLGRTTGDFEYGAIAAQCWTTNAFVAGLPLLEVERTTQDITEFMRRHQQSTALTLHEPTARLIGVFLGRSADSASLSYDGFDEETALASAAESASVAFVTLSDMMVARYHFGKPEEAWQLAQRAAPLQGGATATHHLVTFHLYGALAAAEVARRQGSADRGPFLTWMDQSIAAFESWSAAGPDNFEHRLLLLQAERAWVADDSEAAGARYAEALEAARGTEYVNDEALVAERHAAFERALGRDPSALLDQARAAYQRWGAVAKVAQLS